MTYPDVIKYLDSFIDYEKIPQYPYRQSLKLERIKEFLEVLNNPQDDLRCIHIAGTKGKGSTSAFIAYILREAGCRVGLYTSPHLSDFRERIRVLEPRTRKLKPKTEFEGMIQERELIDLVEQLRPCIEEYNAQSCFGSLSFFEVYTALAFKYFNQKNVDFAVLETGLGGRLDATNTVNSLIAAITPISYEHIRQLGNTLTEIAKEKAGIIKSSSQLASPSIVISAPQEEEVIEVIKQSCKKHNANLYEIGRDVIVEGVPSRNGQCFNINGAFGRLAGLKIRLLGRHQVINAALAVTAVLAVRRFHRVRLALDAIKKGLYNTVWPGRFEIISKNPLVVIDGAQNVASAQVLKETIIENFPGRRLILVLGVSQDKDISGICNTLIPLSDEVILTQADNPRAADVDVIGQIVSSQPLIDNNRINKARRVKEAIELSVKKAKDGDLILITGSLFLVGEVRDLFIKKC